MFSAFNYTLLESILFLPTWVNRGKLHAALDGKTVLVTGASFGIGESLIEELADSGAHLILAARTLEKLREIQDKVVARGGRATIFAIDLTQPAEIEKLLDALRLIEGGVDIFVNNAGKSIRRSIFDSLDRNHDFTRTMALNYFAPVQLMLGLIPILQKNRGHVISVSAVNVLLLPAAKWAAYQASKTAFDQWLRAVAPELNAVGVATSTVYLPLVRTRMIEPTEMYRKAPAMNPRHAARIIAKMIVTRRRRSAPWWLIFGEFASLILRRPFESLSSYLLRKKS